MKAKQVRFFHLLVRPHRAKNFNVPEDVVGTGVRMTSICLVSHVFVCDHLSIIKKGTKGNEAKTVVSIIGTSVLLGLNGSVFEQWAAFI